jgi:membrane-associated phospholipid phosphatase
VIPFNNSPQGGIASAHLCFPVIACTCLSLAFVWQLLAVPQQHFFIAINQHGHHLPPEVWQTITLLGDTQVVLCLLSVLLSTHPVAVLNIVASIPVGGLISIAFKSVFSSPRPGDVLDPSLVQGMLGQLSGKSFPSGHSLTAFCTAFSFWYAQRLAGTSVVARLFWHLSLGAAVLIALSRVMLGVHWPIDTVAGASMGWIAGISGALILKQYPVLQKSTRVIRGLSLVLCIASVHLAFRAIHQQGATAALLWAAVVIPWLNLIWQCKSSTAFRASSGTVQSQ